MLNGWRATVGHPQFRAGMREMAPLSVGIAAWGLVTGVAMVKSGLSVGLALLMTLAVFAGSAQLAALPLMAGGAPVWVIWATAFCINLRFLIFSAHWRPFLIGLPRLRRVALGYLAADLSYVVFMRRFSEPRSGEGQVEYLLGGALQNWLAWQLPSIAGILLADAIPTQWGLGFAGVMALLGLFCSMLGDRATQLAGFVGASAAIAAYALPMNLNIVVAIAAAVGIGLLLEAGGPPPEKPAPAGPRLDEPPAPARPRRDGSAA